MGVSKSHILTFTLLLISNCCLWSQVELDHVWNNKLNVKYLNTSRWKAALSFGNRAEIDNIIGGSQEADNLDFNFVEFNHELTYNLNNRFDLGLETRFRYKTLFDDTEDNEIRIAPFLIFTDVKGVKENSYELKTEIRRKPASVAYRLRLVYQLEQPFKAQLEKENPLKWFVGTTFLSQIEADERTSIEVRIAAGIKKTFWKNFDFALSVQLRNEYDFDEFDVALFYGTALGYKF